MNPENILDRLRQHLREMEARVALEYAKIQKAEASVERLASEKRELERLVDTLEKEFAKV